jgi:hypothetical protein
MNDNNLKIKHKDKSFSEIFETQKELNSEDNDTEPANKKIYQETRHLSIIKEQHSAKFP